ncbi:IS200/IS605 family transposase [bacterium]|nr:MAG: IS200/IS605 family transposase [bacterium]
MYHLVWIPKYRKRILKGAIAKRIEELFRQCAEVNRWEIHELNIQSDHVHMLIQIKPSISVSMVVQLFKGGSSKIMREEFAELEEFCGEIASGQMAILQKQLASAAKKLSENIFRTSDIQMFIEKPRLLSRAVSLL